MNTKVNIADIHRVGVDLAKKRLIRNPTSKLTLQDRI